MTAPAMFADLTNAIIAALQAASLLVGDGIQPAGAGWQGAPGQSDHVGWCVVHPLLGGITEGSLDEPHGDSEAVYQVSSYGDTRDAAEIIAGLAHAAVLGMTGTALTSDTVKYVDSDVLGGARRDDEAQPPNWVAVPRYRFYTSPTS